jgi:hypothetical protein
MRPVRSVKSWRFAPRCLCKCAQSAWKLIDSTRDEGDRLGGVSKHDITARARVSLGEAWGFDLDEERRGAWYLCITMYKDIPGWHAAQGKKGGAAWVKKQSAATILERSRRMVKAKKEKHKTNTAWIREYLEKKKRKEKETIGVITRKDFERL